MIKIITLTLATLTLSACSVFGESNVEIAPYTVIEQAQNAQKHMELRHYDELVLVSAPMTSRDERNSAFRLLFNYISGENVAQDEIPMTAPVFMDDDNKAGTKIPMTAPVFMNDESAQSSERVMSFVLPKDMTMDSAPLPTNPDVKLHAIRDYTVAVIVFNGRLEQDNINKHLPILQEWVAAQGYEQTGEYKIAGYNAPFTLPAARRNEILIPVKKP